MHVLTLHAMDTVYMTLSLAQVFFVSDLKLNMSGSIHL